MPTQLRHESLKEGEARTLRWALAQLHDPDQRSEATELFVAPEWRDRDWLISSMRMWSLRIGSFEEREAKHSPDGVIEASLRDRRDRRWVLRLRLDAENRIAGASLFRPVPPGFSIRRANEADWGALAELERSCPTETAQGSSTSIDRGEMLKPHFDLQGEYTIWLAEYEGKVVGARAFTVREGVLGGTPRRLCYSHFVRVLPDYQSRGLFQPLNAMALESLQRSTDGMFAYMDPGNDAMRAAIGGGMNDTGWNVHAQRLALRCADHAVAGPGRSGRRGDAAHVARLVNACHGREGFFSEYSEESVTRRLERVPTAYSWNDLLVGERAMVGVWMSGEHRRVRHEGSVRESVRSPVLDYGFDGEAGLEELIGLLGEWCHAARQAGTTHLTLFSSKPSRGWDRLSALADEIESFEFPCFIPAPEDLEQRGLYVDALYF